MSNKEKFGLHFEYFSGQTFDLTQENMNKMIEDVHTLLSENRCLESALGDVTEDYYDLKWRYDELG